MTLAPAFILLGIFISSVEKLTVSVRTLEIAVIKESTVELNIRLAETPTCKSEKNEDDSFNKSGEMRPSVVPIALGL